GRARMWRRVSVPGNDRDDRRREHLGLSVLERGQVAFALLQHRRRTLRALYPGNELLRQFNDESRLVVSEPLGDELPGAWNEVPESSWGVIKPGRDELHAFTPAVDVVGARR